MQWMVRELVRPVAGRVGGQVSAALVGIGMAVEHEIAVGAVVAWLIATAAEAAVSVHSRKKLVEKAKTAWGKNQ